MEGKTRVIRVRRRGKAKESHQTITSTTATVIATSNTSTETKRDELNGINHHKKSLPTIPREDAPEKDKFDELYDPDKDRERKNFLEYIDRLMAEAEVRAQEKKNPTKDKQETPKKINKDKASNHGLSNKKYEKNLNNQPGVQACFTRAEAYDNMQQSKSCITKVGKKKKVQDRPKWLVTLSLPPITQAKNMRLLRKKIDKLEAIERPNEKIIDELKKAKQLLQNPTSAPRFSYERWTDPIL